MRLKVPAFAMAAVLTVAGVANAAPMLQLDIAGGSYDAQTKTIVANSDPFVLYALLTLRPTDDVQKYLGMTYYISAAVQPVAEQPGADLGSFTWNGSPVAVTADMVYGKAPLEQFDELQGADSGDLSGHSIFPTYFTEFGFQFQSATRVRTYDAAVDRSGPVADANGGSYLVAFTVDTSLLDPRFVLHFDLYSTKLKQCGAAERNMLDDPACRDIDVTNFAPFSHDAQSPPVPEPATMTLLGLGLGAGAVRRYRQRKVVA